MFKLTKKKVAAGFIAAGIVATSGIAYAYWTAPGSGAGSATTASAISATLTGAPASGLYPGAPAVTILGTVTVSNGATSAYIGTVTPSIDTANTTFQDLDGVGGNPACAVTDYLFATHAINAPVAAGASGVNFGTIQLKDTAANQDNCKGQVLALSFSSN